MDLNTQPIISQHHIVTSYLMRAVYSPSSDLGKAVLGIWVSGFVWACTENLVDRF